MMLSEMILIKEYDSPQNHLQIHQKKLALYQHPFFLVANPLTKALELFKLLNAISRQLSTQLVISLHVSCMSEHKKCIAHLSS
jgi:hypothetical protein